MRASGNAGPYHDTPLQFTKRERITCVHMSIVESDSQKSGRSLSILYVVLPANLARGELHPPPLTNVKLKKKY